MTALVSGGCKNGKSTHAEHLAAALRQEGRPLYYLATMQPHDGEDEERIARHQRSRAHLDFTTVEAGRDILAVLKDCDPRGSFLLDSTTALLANEMFLPDGSTDPQAHQRLAPQLLELMERVEALVIVSDYIYSDCFDFDPLTENYRRGLAYLDRVCAQKAQMVLEACAGTLFAHKGREIYEKLF